MRQWSELVPELCLMIAAKLLSVIDVAMFRAVCRSWEAATSDMKHTLLSPKTPCLMLVNEDEAGFILFPRKKFLPIHFPGIQGKTCFGTPYGWLITVSLNREVHLVNTVSGIRHEFPQIQVYDTYAFPLSCIHKAVTSLASPSCTVPEDCVVVVIFSKNKQLGFAKLGDTDQWNTLVHARRGYEDVLYFMRQFYAVNDLGELKVCELDSPDPGAKLFAPPPPPFRPNKFHRLFLVEMNGHLHMIVRTQSSNNSYAALKKVAFDIYRFDFHTKKWTKLTSIDEHALFIGDNSCFSVLASDYPDCKGNLVYFTWETLPRGYDISVFDVKLRKNKLVKGPRKGIPLSCPPLWIIPKMC